MNTLNYPGDVTAEFRVGTYAANIYGDTMTDTAGYPLMVRGSEFNGENTVLHVEVVGRPAKGAK